ncbi:MAG: hypothetical protein ACTMIX_11890, partial [Kluyvera intermedia]
CHTASADLKELSSADLHGSLLVSTLLLLVVFLRRSTTKVLKNVMPSVPGGLSIRIPHYR